MTTKMNARLNPLAQVPYSIAKGVRRNTGVLSFNVTFNDHASRHVEKYTFRRTVWLLDPEPVSEYVVASGQYLAGDMKAYVPALSLEEALNTESDDDPACGDAMGLKDFRVLNPSNGGIDAAADTLEFGGINYRILQVFPENIWGNVPNQFKLVLRRV